MDFCDKCDNMYYLSVSDDDANTLVYYCKNCGDVNRTAAKRTNVLKHVVSTHTPMSKINQYTKYDPTIPINNTVSCPNDKCESNSDERKKKILYVRYDDTNMKYAYLCSSCDNVWELNV